MLGQPELEAIRWMYPSGIRKSEDAKSLFDRIESEIDLDTDFLINTNQYLMWQAYASAAIVFKGAERALTSLSHCYEIIVNNTEGKPNVQIEAILSGIFLIASRTGRFDTLNDLLLKHLVKFPKSLYAQASLIKLHLIRGEIELAEYRLRSNIFPQRSLHEAHEYIYWTAAMGMFDELRLVKNMLPNLYPDEAFRSDLNYVLDVASHLLTIEWRPPVSASNIVTFCINMPGDFARWRRVEAVFGKIGVKLRRVAGIDADSLPKVVKMSLATYPAGAGELGCYLAHVSAWEKIVEETLDCALILEDDAVPVYNFSLDRLIEKMPPDADLCFINQRAKPNWQDTTHVSQLYDYQFISFDDISSADYARSTIIGGDGYIMTRSGAQKFIELHKQTGLVCPVDFQLFVASFNGKFYNDIFSADRVGPIGAAIAEIGRLKSYMLAFPAIKELDLGYSPRRANTPQ